MANNSDNYIKKVEEKYSLHVETSTQRKRRELLLEAIKDREGKILDIGCQTGDLCYMLYKEGFEPYGVDIYEDLITVAKQKYQEIKFKVADCEKEIPFEDNFFDVVWAGDVIEHVRFTDVFVNEVNRVLKAGGLFVLSTPCHNIVKNIIISIVNFEKHFDPESPHVRFYTPNSLKQVLEKRGFKILSVKYVGRVRPLSKNMFVLGEKIRDEEVYSKVHY